MFCCKVTLSNKCFAVWWHCLTTVCYQVEHFISQKQELPVLLLSDWDLKGTTLIFGQASCSSLIHDMSVWISDLFLLFFFSFFFPPLLILPSWVTECMKNQLSIISVCQPHSLSLVSSNHRKPNEEDVGDQVLLTVRIIFCALVYSP